MPAIRPRSDRVTRAQQLKVMRRNIRVVSHKERRAPRPGGRPAGRPSSLEGRGGRGLALGRNLGAGPACRVLDRIHSSDHS